VPNADSRQSCAVRISLFNINGDIVRRHEFSNPNSVGAMEISVWAIGPGRVPGDGRGFVKLQVKILCAQRLALKTNQFALARLGNWSFRRPRGFPWPRRRQRRRSALFVAPGRIVPYRWRGLVVIPGPNRAIVCELDEGLLDGLVLGQQHQMVVNIRQRWRIYSPAGCPRAQETSQQMIG